MNGFFFLCNRVGRITALPEQKRVYVSLLQRTIPSGPHVITCTMGTTVLRTKNGAAARGNTVIHENKNVKPYRHEKEITNHGTCLDSNIGRSKENQV